MELKICDICGDEFDGEYWQKYCFDCWKQNKIENGEWEQCNKKSNILHELHKLKRDNNELLQELYNYKRIYTLIFHSPNQSSDEFIKNLIFLCHPDKHANSELSNKITVKLIEIKNMNISGGDVNV